MRLGFRFRLAATGLVVLLGLSAVAAKQATIPAEFHGDWVPQAAVCASAPARLRVTAGNLALINGADSQSWGNVAVPTSFFGPDYKGISVVAIADFDGTQPFSVYFNENEKKGVTRAEIYTPMPGPANPQVAKLQAAAKQLATRFPVNNVPLKKCPPSR